MIDKTRTYINGDGRRVRVVESGSAFVRIADQPDGKRTIDPRGVMIARKKFETDYKAEDE